MPTNRVLYLLHIELNDGERAHYIGITERGRETARLKEHRRDRRNPRLFALLARSTSVQIHIIEQRGTFGLERFFLHAHETTIRSEICDTCRALSIAGAQDTWQHKTATDQSLRS